MFGSKNTAQQDSVYAWEIKVHYEEFNHKLILFKGVVVDLIAYSINFVLHLIYNKLWNAII